MPRLPLDIGLEVLELLKTGSDEIVHQSAVVLYVHYQCFDLNCEIVCDILKSRMKDSSFQTERILAKCLAKYFQGNWDYEICALMVKWMEEESTSQECLNCLAMFARRAGETNSRDLFQGVNVGDLVHTLSDLLERWGDERRVVIEGILDLVN
jgi:hypothetical protein